MSILDYAAPRHPTEREPAGTLLAIAAGAVLANWMVAPALYQVITGHKLFSSTQPATQPAIDPRDLIALSVVAPLLGLMTLTIGNVLWRKHAFDRTGLTLSHLRRGCKQALISVAIVLPAMFAVLLITEKFWNLIHFSHPSEHALLTALGVEPTLGVRIAIVISAVVLAPMFEEFLFRGMLQGGLRMLMPRWFAIVIASLAFTAVHGALWMLPPIFFLSLCLGYAYEKTGNLWVSIIVHATFNAASVTMFLISR